MPILVVLACVTIVLLSTVSSCTRLEMSVTGSGCRSTAFTTLKMVVLAPMPSARETTQMMVKLGLLYSERRPKWTS